jgi:hypothetical protein
MVNRRLLILLGVVALAGGCRSRDVQKDLKVVDVHTGWYDLGVQQGKNKLVPSISLKLQNVSPEEISNVKMNVVFRRVGENEAWGDKFINAVDGSGLKAGATGNPLVVHSDLGYTGEESRAEMLRNSQFVDARVEVFGKHGSNNWAKMGEFPIERKLLANP